METERLTVEVAVWLGNYAREHGIKTLVVGVSGGIDSAVVFRLCEMTELDVIAVAMPMSLESDSCPDSLARAIELTKDRDASFIVRPIGAIMTAYESVVGFSNTGCVVGFPAISTKHDSLPSKLKTHQISKEDQRLLFGNIRSRIRANILYHYAGMFGGIVVGTGNKDEDEIGYFTKGGDGLVDICPLSKIHKSQVWEMAAVLNVPNSIISAKPTAGLWDGQTDEEELGMSYAEVEWALKQIENIMQPKGFFPFDLPDTTQYTDRQKEVLQKVAHRRAKHAHKLKYPPIFEPEQ